MGDIYHGASFTIAASNARTSKEGFLSECPQEAYRIQIKDKVRRSKRLMMLCSFQEPSNPLHSRGWTLQEGNSIVILEHNVTIKMLICRSVLFKAIRTLRPIFGRPGMFYHDENEERLWTQLKVWHQLNRLDF